MKTNLAEFIRRTRGGGGAIIYRGRSGCVALGRGRLRRISASSGERHAGQSHPQSSRGAHDFEERRVEAGAESGRAQRSGGGRSEFERDFYRRSADDIAAADSRPRRCAGRTIIAANWRNG